MGSTYIHHTHTRVFLFSLFLPLFTKYPEFWSQVKSTVESSIFQSDQIKLN